MRGRGRGGSTSSLVVEDATEVVSVRENVRLVREVCAARVDEIDTWEAWHVSVYLAEITWPPFMGHTIFLGDCLCSKMFLHGNWVIGASFDSAIDSDVDLELGGNDWHTCYRWPQSCTVHPVHSPHP